MPKRFIDYSFTQQSEFEFVNYRPEIIAAAIEELGANYAIANYAYEQAKDQAEFILNKLTVKHKGDRNSPSGGSISGARAIAEVDEEYRLALGDRRKAEMLKIKAQSSFKAGENYAKMIITKVSSESKIGEHYKSANLT